MPLCQIVFLPVWPNLLLTWLEFLVQNNSSNSCNTNITIFILGLLFKHYILIAVSTSKQVRVVEEIQIVYVVSWILWVRIEYTQQLGKIKYHICRVHIKYTSSPHLQGFFLHKKWMYDNFTKSTNVSGQCRDVHISKRDLNEAST